jgi:hypothetical protein
MQSVVKAYPDYAENMINILFSIVLCPNIVLAEDTVVEMKQTLMNIATEVIVSNVIRDRKILMMTDIID